MGKVRRDRYLNEMLAGDSNNSEYRGLDVNLYYDSACPQIKFSLRIGSMLYAYLYVQVPT